MDIPLDEVIYFDAIASSSTGAAADADSTPTFAVYEEATDTDIGVGGNMTKRTSLTGNYRGSFTLSAANGFEVGKWYIVVGSATIGSVATKGLLKHFRVVAAEAIAGKPKVDVDAWLGTAAATPTVAGVPEVDVTHYAGSTTDVSTMPSRLDAAVSSRSTLTQAQVTGGAYALDTDANGRIRIVDGTAAGELDTSSGKVFLSGTQVFDNTGTWTGNITGNLSGSVGSVTGAVGSVTGNVGGNVTGTIGGLTAAALKDFFDTDSTTTAASAVAGSVVYEIGQLAASGGLTASDIADEVQTRTIARVTLVDTTTTNTDVTTLSGTVNKILAAVVTEAAGLIVDASATATTFNTNLTAATGIYDDCRIKFTSGSLAPEQKAILSYSSVNGAITLDEPLTAAPANGDAFIIISDHVHPVTQIATGVRTELATELGRIDAAITSRGTSTLTQAQVTGGAYALDTDANGRIRVVDGTGTGELDTNAGKVLLASTQTFDNTGTWTGNITGSLSGAVGSVTGAVGSVTGNVGGNVTGSIGSVASGGIAAASIAVAAAEKIADITLRRSQTNVEASAFGDAVDLGSVYGLIQQAQKSDTTTNAGKLTVFKLDGTTELGQLTVGTSPTAEPLVSVA